MLSNSVQARNRRPPRRKSCTECIKAKRRCDQGSKSCARCSKQKLQCRYLASPVSDPRDHSTRNNELEDVIEWPATGQNESLGMINSTNNGAVFSASFDLFPGLEDLFSSNTDTALPNPAYSPTFSTPSHQMVASTSSSQLSSLSVSRFDYGITQLKLAPSKMVLENQTPWSHALLYAEDMPRSMHGTK